MKRIQSMEQQMRLLEEQIELRKQQMAVVDEEAKKFLQLRLQGLRTPEIAQICNVSSSHVTSTILEYEKRYGLPSSHNASRAVAADKRTDKLRRNMATVVETADIRGEKFRSLKLQGLTLEEIGKMYEISRERVRQLIVRYEKGHNLPPAIPVSREMKTAAKEADIKEYKAEQKFEKQKQYKRFVSSFQLDAHLVGRFLSDLGKKSVLYGFAGKSQRNPRRNRNGIPYPSMNEPTNIYVSGSERTGRRHVTVHSWVLKQYGMAVENGQHCHHIDGDVTNNMLENLQVLSNVEHGRITWQEQMTEGTIDFENNPRHQHALTNEQVEEIRAQYQPEVTTIAYLAKVYDTSYETMHKAVHGLGAYKNVSPLTRHVLKRSSLVRSLTIEQVEEIRTQYQPGITSFDTLADTYGVSKKTIRKALYGQAGYSDVNPATRHTPRKSNSEAEQMLLDFGL